MYPDQRGSSLVPRVMSCLRKKGRKVQGGGGLGKLRRRVASFEQSARQLKKSAWGIAGGVHQKGRYTTKNKEERGDS